MANPSPYVAVACVCEKVLIEADNVASIIRIVDIFHLQIPKDFAAVPARPTGITLTAFIALKAGEVRGQHEVGLELRQPNGKKGERKTWPVVMTKPEDGANFKVDFVLVGKDGAPPEVGLYWFDVFWGDDVLTSIPFRLTQPEPTAAPVLPTAT